MIMYLFLLVLLQVPRSQHGSVTQRVGTTDIAISYNRPVARGRELFGTLVRWGRMWHPGADSATTISFSKDVTIDGHALKAGRYTLWTIPEEAKPWTVIFNRGVGGWHTNYPGESQDALRLTVEWYRAYQAGAEMRGITLSQIQQFLSKQEALQN